MRTLIRAIVPGLILGVLLPTSCGGNDNNGPPPGENTGAACTSVSQCYPGLDGGALQGGPATCLAKVTGGYCTHQCTQDSDCCAVSGECRTGLHEVCAPLENDPTTYCFISCESGDILAGYNDTNFCQRFATSVFGCRASGGGNPRKVCLP